MKKNQTRQNFHSTDLFAMVLEFNEKLKHKINVKESISKRINNENGQ